MSFGGVPERLVVPFAAIKSFVDPSVQFGVQFEMLVAGEDGKVERADAAPGEGRRRAHPPAERLAARRANPPSADQPANPSRQHRIARQRRRAAAKSCGSTASARSDVAAPHPRRGPS